MSSDMVRHQNAEPAAVGLSDVLELHLSVVFCRLNPVLTSVRDGRNFSSPSNRFWKVLHLSGYTPRLLQAEEEAGASPVRMRHYRRCLRATRRACELTTSDYKEAGPLFDAKMRRFAPANLAFLGKAAFAAITSKPDCDWGMTFLPEHKHGYCPIPAGSTELSAWIV